VNSVTKIACKASGATEKISKILVVPLCIAFFLIVFWGVITRFILKTPFVSSMEFARICFVWFCFIGSSLAYKYGEHIQFTFVLSRVPEKVRKVMVVIIDLLELGFFTILLSESIKLTDKVSMTIFPASSLSYSVMYISLPITAVFLIIHSIFFICRDVSSLAHKKEV